MSARVLVELLPMVRPGRDYLQLVIDIGDDEELTHERVEAVLEDALQGLRSGGFMLRSRRELPESLQLHKPLSDWRPAS